MLEVQDNTDYGNQIYELIRNTSQFKKLAFRLSAKLHIRLFDAKDILIDHVFSKVQAFNRNHNKTYYDDVSIISGKEKGQRYFIDYCIYNGFNDAQKELFNLKFHKKITHNGKVIKLDTCQLNEFNFNQAIDDSNLHNKLNFEQIIDIVYQVLPESAAEFTTCVLLYGEDETKVIYNYNSNKFYQRIRYIEKIMRKKRVKYRHLLLSPLERHQQKDLKRLNLLINCLESPDYNDVKLSNLLSKMQNVTIITNLLADNVSNIRLFIQSFGQDKQEAYRFINALYRQYNYLKKKLRDA
jgi:hypothetical protein